MKYRRFLSLLMVLVIASFQLHPVPGLADEKKEGGKKETKKKEPRLAGAEEILKAIKGGVKFYLIDTRTKTEYASGHIRKAVNLPMNDFGPASLEHMVPDKKSRVVFYCEDEECPSAMDAATKAMEFGYEKVYKYRTGYSDWKDHGYAIDP